MKTQDLLSHFNLTRLPFSKEIPTDQLMELPSLQRAFSSAGLLVETHGIGLLLGKSGTGKSCLLRKSSPSPSTPDSTSLFISAIPPSV